MQITIRIAGDEYTLTRDDILRVAQSTRPERIDTFYVAVEEKHFPPTQLSVRRQALPTEPIRSMPGVLSPGSDSTLRPRAELSWKSEQLYVFST